jgi:hypothetical protein
MADGTVLEIPAMVGIADPPKRVAQAATKSWPAGTRIISADSHWLEGDLWIDRFPPHLRDKAPRMQFIDGGWVLTVNGKSMFPAEQNPVLCESLECVPGMTNVAARMKDLDIEGVEKELLFPQRLFGLNMSGDIDYREHIYSAYNQYMSEVCAQAPDRLYFAAIPNFWDMSAARASVE